MKTHVSMTPPPPAPVPTIEYPCLMRHVHTGMVVLATAPQKGMVLHAGNEDKKVGYMGDNWGFPKYLESNCIFSWTILADHDSVTLSN